MGGEGFESVREEAGVLPCLKSVLDVCLKITPHRNSKIIPKRDSWSSRPM